MPRRIDNITLFAIALTASLTACTDDLSEPTVSAPAFRTTGGIERWGLHTETRRGLAFGGGGETRAPLSQNLSLVGFLGFDLGPDEFVSDVWAHGSAAYVGGYMDGFFAPRTRAKVIDISNPANPFVVTELEPMGTFSSPQDVKAMRIDTRDFHGDLLVVGHDGPHGGIQLWNVTDPATPTLVAELNDPGDGAWFVHNTFPYQRGNRAYVAMVVPLEEEFGFSGRGDVMFADITDPSNPHIVGDWGAGKDGGLPFGFFSCVPSVCRGVTPFAFAHDIWVNEQGTVAYVAYWDLGLVLLDVSDPIHPTMLGRGIAPPTFGNDDGDLHVAVPVQGGNLVVTGDEDVSPAFGGSLPWGFMRVFDTVDETQPVQIGAFATDAARNDPTFSDPFEHTMHNVIVRGAQAYVSWYGDGIRIIDLSQPSAPREIAAFTPSPELSPGVFWGVYPHQDLVLGSDFLGGLYILKVNS